MIGVSCVDWFAEVGFEMFKLLKVEIPQRGSGYTKGQSLGHESLVKTQANQAQ